MRMNLYIIKLRTNKQVFVIDAQKNFIDKITIYI